MRFVLLIATLSLTGCTTLVSWTHPDHIACGRRGARYEARPDVYLHLGTASQVCAGSDGFAEVVVFVNLYNLPPQEVRFVFNEKVEVRMFGKDIALTMHRVRIGEHNVVVSTAGHHDVSLSFSVWGCP